MKFEARYPLLLSCKYYDAVIPGYLQTAQPMLDASSSFDEFIPGPGRRRLDESEQGLMILRGDANRETLAGLRM